MVPLPHQIQRQRHRRVFFPREMGQTLESSQQHLISDDVIMYLPSGLIVTHENRASFSVARAALGLRLPS